MHLKSQITDFHTTVFLLEIKVVVVFVFLLLLLSSPETDEGSHKINSQ